MLTILCTCIFTHWIIPHNMDDYTCFKRKIILAELSFFGPLIYARHRARHLACRLYLTLPAPQKRSHDLLRWRSWRPEKELPQIPWLETGAVVLLAGSTLCFLYCASILERILTFNYFWNISPFRSPHHQMISPLGAGTASDAWHVRTQYLLSELKKADLGRFQFSSQSRG